MTEPRLIRSHGCYSSVEKGKGEIAFGMLMPIFKALKDRVLIRTEQSVAGGGRGKEDSRAGSTK